MSFPRHVLLWRWWREAGDWCIQFINTPPRLGLNGGRIAIWVRKKDRSAAQTWTCTMISGASRQSMLSRHVMADTGVDFFLPATEVLRLKTVQPYMEQKNTQEDEKDDIIDAIEAAKILKMHPVTVRLKAKAQQVPGRQIGSMWRFSRRRLYAFVAGD